MILQTTDEVAPGMYLYVILTDDWLNNTLYDVEKIIKSKSSVKFPAKADREKYLVLKHKDSSAFFFVADHNTLSYTRRMRCSLEIGRRLSTYFPHMDEDDLITKAGEAINEAYMTVLEKIIKEAK